MTEVFRATRAARLSVAGTDSTSTPMTEAMFAIAATQLSAAGTESAQQNPWQKCLLQVQQLSSAQRVSGGGLLCPSYMLRESIFCMCCTAYVTRCLPPAYEHHTMQATSSLRQACAKARAWGQQHIQGALCHSGLHLLFQQFPDCTQLLKCQEAGSQTIAKAAGEWKPSSSQQCRRGQWPSNHTSSKCQLNRGNQGCLLHGHWVQNVHMILQVEVRPHTSLQRDTGSKVQ